MTTTDWKNQLYFGDNLDILRNHVADASVDLIYLDPPFNSNATRVTEEAAMDIPSPPFSSIQVHWVAPRSRRAAPRKRGRLAIIPRRRGAG